MEFCTGGHLVNGDSQDTEGRGAQLGWPGPTGAAHLRPAQLSAQRTVAHNNTYVDVKKNLGKVTAWWVS